MSSEHIDIGSLNKLLMRELYKSYREQPDELVDGLKFFKLIQSKYHEKYIIEKNDFIVSLNSLASKYIIEQHKTMAGGIPLYLQVKPSIVTYIEEIPSMVRDIIKPINQNLGFNGYIKIVFKDYNLSEFDIFTNLINKCVSDDQLYRLLPFLLRLLFEKLLYQIFLKAIHKSQKFLYFSNRPHDFSKLIHLLNILKDKEFKEIHTGSIDQGIITILKEIQKTGNKTVHNITRQIDKDYCEKWKDKVNRALQNLVILHRDLPRESIYIENVMRVDKFRRLLENKYTKQEIKTPKIKINENFNSKLINEILINSNFNKGEFITLIRDIGKRYFNNIFNLSFSDSNNIIVLSNNEWRLKIYGPSVTKPYRFVIWNNKLNEDNIYRDNSDNIGNAEVLSEFVKYLIDCIKEEI